MDFGFTISKPRSIEPTEAGKEQLRQLEELVPTFRRCMNCGGCTATCSAGQFTDFNIRKVHNLYRWGQYKELDEELKKCMLCGKCTLVCPRGVNLRSLIIHLRKALNKDHLPNDFQHFIRNNNR